MPIRSCLFLSSYGCGSRLTSPPPPLTVDSERKMVFLFSRQQLVPARLIASQRYSKRSIIAVASSSSFNVWAHSVDALLVVMMTEVFSWKVIPRWQNEADSSFFTRSSMMSSMASRSALKSFIYSSLAESLLYWFHIQPEDNNSTVLCLVVHQKEYF